MDRATVRTVGYCCAIGGMTIALFVLLPWPPGLHYLAVAPLLLLPGRIQGILWRKFFRGRLAAAKRDYAAAGEQFDAFLEQLRQHPRLRYAAFLAWNFYTWNAEAMTRNNLGACQLAQGNIDSAKNELTRARDLDPGCPLPYFNLAVLAHIHGQNAEAERLRTHASNLGYRAGTREKLIEVAGTMLATIEGQPKGT